MNQSPLRSPSGQADKPINLAKLLRDLRRQHRLSLNRLAKLTGISRRTLARLEARAEKTENRKEKTGGSGHQSRVTSHKSPGLSARTAMRLVKLLLPREHIEQTLADATRLSRAFGDDPLYKFLDALYYYPAFLFHRSAAEALSAVEGSTVFREYARDYRHSLDFLLRSGFGTRNLGRRLRAFRLQHDLTQQEVADLLGLSDTHVAALEAGSRRASPRTRYRILRLLAIPVRLEEMPRVPRAKSRGARHQWIELVKMFLSLPPPASDDSNDPRNALRYFWLTSGRSTRQLAADLGIGQPHLIRLLRGDRRPSRKLRERIQNLTGHPSRF